MPLAPAKIRTPGKGAGRWDIVGEFNDPLPAKLLAAFYSRAK